MVMEFFWGGGGAGNRGLRLCSVSLVVGQCYPIRVLGSVNRGLF